MAIIIEEERNRGMNPISVLVWAGMLIVLGIGMYYLFIAQPELVDYVAPASFKDTEQLARIEINSEGILSDSRFQALRPYITLPEGTVFGRANPFLGFEFPSAALPAQR